MRLSRLLLSTFLLAPSVLHADLMERVRDPLLAEKRVAGTASHLRPEACPEQPEKGATLSMGQTIALALCNNAATRASYLGLLAQANSFATSQLEYVPEVRAAVGANVSRSQSEGVNAIDRSSSASLTSSYLLYDFGRREASVGAAEQALVASQHGFDSTLQGLIAATLQAYYQLLSAQASLDSARSAEEFAAESLKAANVRFAVGLAPRGDTLQAETSNSSAILSRQSAENQVKISRAALANIINLPPDADFAIADVDAGEMEKPPLEGRVQKWMEEAKEKRADLKAARASLESARSSYDALRRSDNPSIGVSASRSYDDWDLSNRNRRLTNRDTVGLSVSIPIFSGISKTYNERSAKRSLEAQEIQYEQAGRDVMQDVFRAWNNFETAVESYRTSLRLVESATEVRNIALGRYKEGIGTILDVLNAQSQYQGALQSRVSAQTGLLASRVDLVRAAGLLNRETAVSQATLNDVR